MSYSGEEFTPVSHEKDGDWVIRTVYDAGSSGIRITQTIDYTDGSAYYRKSWTLENESDEKTYTDLRFIHGGDAYFGGYDSSLGHWDPSLRMVYLTNPDMGISGIMGFYGAASSPADNYFEGRYYDVYDNIVGGQLPDSVRDDYHDSGYALQWNRASLAPGESWTIVSYEKWTEAGFVQVFAPSDGEGSPGDTISYLFTVSNEQSDDTLFNFSAVSVSGWDVVLPVTSLTIPAGEAANVEVKLTVAADAVVGAEDILTLIAVAADDESVTNADSVTTVVLPVRTGSLTVIIEPEEAAAAGAQWRRVGTATWFNSGATEADVPVGTHLLEFKGVPGFVLPAGVAVTIGEGETSSAAAAYSEAPPEVKPEETTELPQTGGGMFPGIFSGAVAAIGGALLLRRRKNK